MRVALPDSKVAAERRALRARLSAKRRQVNEQERAHAAERIARNVDRAFHLRAGWRIAAYAALPEELDSAPLIALAEERGCRIYLPRIDRRRRSRSMRFVAMRGALRENRLGIAEPEVTESLGARWLDVVFLPLVGFDCHGLRLGTGGGFYDRAFAFRHMREVWRGPLLVGIGYAFQELEHIAAAPHDVRMDAVVTEEGVIRCTTG